MLHAAFLLTKFFKRGRDYGLLETGTGTERRDHPKPQAYSSECRGGVEPTEHKGVCDGKAARIRPKADRMRTWCDSNTRQARQNTFAARRHGRAADAGGERRAVCLPHRRNGSCLRTRYAHGDAADGGENAERKRRRALRHGEIDVPARGGDIRRRARYAGKRIA